MDTMNSDCTKKLKTVQSIPWIWLQNGTENSVIDKMNLNCTIKLKTIQSIQRTQTAQWNRKRSNGCHEFELQNWINNNSRDTMNSKCKNELKTTLSHTNTHKHIHSSCLMEFETVKQMKWILTAEWNWKQCNRFNEFELHKVIEDIAMVIMNLNCRNELKTMQ